MLFLVTQQKYENICNTVDWQYIKYIYDVISFTMTTTERHERILSFPVFANYLQNDASDLPFLFLFGKVLALVNSSANLAKSFSMENWISQKRSKPKYRIFH